MPGPWRSRVVNTELRTEASNTGVRDFVLEADLSRAAWGPGHQFPPLGGVAEDLGDRSLSATERLQLERNSPQQRVPLLLALRALPVPHPVVQVPLQVPVLLQPERLRSGGSVALTLEVPGTGGVGIPRLEVGEQPDEESILGCQRVFPIPFPV